MGRLGVPPWKNRLRCCPGPFVPPLTALFRPETALVDVRRADGFCTVVVKRLVPAGEGAWLAVSVAAEHALVRGPGSATLPRPRLHVPPAPPSRERPPRGQVAARFLPLHPWSKCPGGDGMGPGPPHSRVCRSAPGTPIRGHVLLQTSVGSGVLSRAALSPYASRPPWGPGAGRGGQSSPMGPRGGAGRPVAPRGARGRGGQTASVRPRWGQLPSCSSPLSGFSSAFLEGKGPGEELGKRGVSAQMSLIPEPQQPASRGRQPRYRWGARRGPLVGFGGLGSWPGPPNATAGTVAQAPGFGSHPGVTPAA